MRRQIRIAVLMAVLLTSLSLILKAQAPSKAELALRAAIQTETVNGDLKKAIDQYKKLAEEKDHAVAAQALLRLASVYQKQGSDEARKVYDLVVRKFPDQKSAVAAAEAQLGVLYGGGKTTRERMVLAGGDISVLAASVSADGRLLAYVRFEEPDGQTLAARDLVTGSVRVLSEKAPKSVFIQSAQISPDGQQVAYQWCDSRCTVRLISLKDRGIPQFRKLYEGRWADVKSWTPDNKALVVYRTFDDKTQDLVLMTVADGSVRVLKKNPGQYANFFVSPDGKFLAMDHPANGRQDYDIFLLPLGGGSEISVVESPTRDILAGWSPDGRYLLFTSDRSGRLGLLAQRVMNGTPDGSPRFLIDGLKARDMNSIGVTAGGTLYFGETPGRAGYSEVQTATIDLQTGVVGKPAFFEERAPTSTPAWSRDGKSLAFFARDNGRSWIVIRNVVTGERREIHPNVDVTNGLKWSPDGRSLLTSGRFGEPSEPGIFVIDVETQIAKRVAVGQEAVWSPNGATIYYRNGNAQSQDDIIFRALDVETGNVREILRRPRLGALHLSPDGRYIATSISDATANTRTVIEVPTNGGDYKALKVIRPVAGGVFFWSPDSRSVIVSDSKELWRVTLDGQETRFLDHQLPGSAFQLSPDGKSIAFVKTITAEQTSEGGVWALDNVLPQATR